MVRRGTCAQRAWNARSSRSCRARNANRRCTWTSTSGVRRSSRGAAVRPRCCRGCRWRSRPRCRRYGARGARCDRGRGPADPRTAPPARARHGAGSSAVAARWAAIGRAQPHPDQSTGLHAADRGIHPPTRVRAGSAARARQDCRTRPAPRACRRAPDGRPRSSWWLPASAVMCRHATHPRAAWEGRRTGRRGRAASGYEATPRAPARAHLPLLPSSPGGVQQDDTARGVATSVTARRPRFRTAVGDTAHDTPGSPPDTPAIAPRPGTSLPPRRSMCHERTTGA